MSLTISSGGSLTLNGGSGGTMPVSASDSGSVTTTSQTWTATGTPISVDATIGSSGKALVTFSAYIVSATANAYLGGMAFSVSGATTVAVDETKAVYAFNASANQGTTTTRTVLVSGLNAGTNTFTLQHRSEFGASRSFYYRTIVVQPL